MHRTTQYFVILSLILATSLIAGAENRKKSTPADSSGDSNNVQSSNDSGTNNQSTDAPKPHAPGKITPAPAVVPPAPPPPPPPPALKPPYIRASINPVKAGIAVQFSTVLDDTGPQPVALAWDFGDGVTGVSDLNGTSHIYSTGGLYTAVCRLDSKNSLSLPVTVFAPASGGTGIANISSGGSPTVNPLNGISIEVAGSEGGVVELAVNIDSLSRAAYGISTQFSGMSAVPLATVTGPRPVNKFDASGIYVAASSAFQGSSTQVAGMARKTLVIGKAETGEARLPQEPLAPNRVLNVLVKKAAGRFQVSTASLKMMAARPDIMMFSGTIELPPGMDMDQNQNFSVSIGNVGDSVVLDNKGRAMSHGTLGRLKMVRVKYPRAGKASALSASGQTARVQVVLSMPGMVPNGFDTEGVSATPVHDILSVQAAILYAGIPYEFNIPAVLKVESSAGMASISSVGR